MTLFELMSRRRHLLRFGYVLALSNWVQRREDATAQRRRFSREGAFAIVASPLTCDAPSSAASAC